MSSSSASECPLPESSSPVRPARTHVETRLTRGFRLTPPRYPLALGATSPTLRGRAATLRASGRLAQLVRPDVEKVAGGAHGGLRCAGAVTRPASFWPEAASTHSCARECVLVSRSGAAAETRDVDHRRGRRASLSLDPPIIRGWLGVVGRVESIDRASSWWTTWERSIASEAVTSEARQRRTATAARRRGNR